MRTESKELARKQLDKRFSSLGNKRGLTRPPYGWVKAIREALGMTSYQLAGRAHVSQPRVMAIEKAEMMGTITLASLERVAQAMECELVYALVPRKPLVKLVEDRARAIAKERLAITGHNMALEAQSVSDEDEDEQMQRMISEMVKARDSALWKE